MSFQIFDFYSVRKGKNDKTYFPPIGVGFMGEDKNGNPKLSLQLNMFPGETFYGSIRKPKDGDDKDNSPW